MAARRDLLEALHAIRIETIEELDGLLRKVLEEDPGFVERFVKQVRIMPDQILALALGHLRREERRPRPDWTGAGVACDESRGCRQQPADPPLVSGRLGPGPRRRLR